MFYLKLIMVAALLEIVVPTRLLAQEDALRNMHAKLEELYAVHDVSRIPGAVPNHLRERFLAVWQTILDQYPSNPVAHEMMVDLCMKCMDGDRAMKHANRLCELDSRGCEKKKKLKENLESFFNTCVVKQGDKECEVTYNSSVALTKLLEGVRLSNRGVVQNWIGRIVKLNGKTVEVLITFVGGTEKNKFEILEIIRKKYKKVTRRLVKGKKYTFFLDDVTRPSKASLEATIKGY